MIDFRAALGRFVRDEAAATAIEYSLVIGILGMLLAGAATAFGNKVRDMFINIAASY